jgi:hypothetical protein
VHEFALREHLREPSRSRRDLIAKKTAHFGHLPGPIVPLATLPCNSYAINDFRVCAGHIVALPLHKMGSDTFRGVRGDDERREEERRGQGRPWVRFDGSG